MNRFALASTPELLALSRDGSAPVLTRGIAAGMLIARGERVSPSGVALSPDVVHEMLAALDDAEQSLVATLQSTTCETGRPSDDERAHIVEALDARANVAALELAASRGAVTMSSGDLDAIAAAAVAFDLAIEPNAHRLVPLEAERGARTRLLDPEFHSMFAVLARGRGVERDTLQHLAEVAAMVATFPSAERELASLVGVERRLRAARPARGEQGTGGAHTGGTAARESAGGPEPATSESESASSSVVPFRPRSSSDDATRAGSPTMQMAAAAGIAVGVESLADDGVAHAEPAAADDGAPIVPDDDSFDDDDEPLAPEDPVEPVLEEDPDWSDEGAEPDLHPDSVPLDDDLMATLDPDASLDIGAGDVDGLIPDGALGPNPLGHEPIPDDEPGTDE